MVEWGKEKVLPQIVNQCSQLMKRRNKRAHLKMFAKRRIKASSILFAFQGMQKPSARVEQTRRRNLRETSERFYALN